MTISSTSYPQVRAWRIRDPSQMPTMQDPRPYLILILITILTLILTRTLTSHLILTPTLASGATLHHYPNHDPSPNLSPVVNISKFLSHPSSCHLIQQLSTTTPTFVTLTLTLVHELIPTTLTLTIARILAPIPISTPYPLGLIPTIINALILSPPLCDMLHIPCSPDTCACY